MTTEHRLVAYSPNGARLGPLPAPISSNLSLPLNDVGALTFTYAPDGPLVEYLGSPIEVAVEVSTDSGATWVEPRNGRYLYLQDGRDPVEDDNWSVSCPGYGRRLDWARVPVTGLNSSGQREFVDKTPGFILGTLVQEAQARGALQGMGSTLLSATDSSGQAWPATYTVAYAPGTSFRAILQAMADNGWLDYRFNGRDLEVFVPETVMGRDLTVGANPIVLRAGRDLSQGPFRRTWEGIADVAWVQGDELTWVERSNPAAIKPWGRLETFVQAGGVTDAGTLAVVGDRTLEQSADFRAEWTFTVLRDSTVTPLGDYLPGDWVFIAPTGQQPERMRVRQVTLTQQGEETGANIVANDRFLEADIRTARDVQKILNTGTNATSGQPSSPIGADILRPAAPVNLSGSSNAYVDAQGFTRATIAVDWPDVVTNIDGTTASDVQFYEVWRRRQGESTWQMLGEFDQSNYQASGYDTGDTWEFRVRAVDNVFNRSPFSDTLAVLTAQDTEAPPKPSVPQVSTADGVLQVIWDGETAAGNPYATPDLKWLEVHVSTENNFVPTQGASGTGSTWKAVIQGGSGFAYRALVEGLPRGVPHYVKFVPVDTSNNVGDTSEQASIVVDIPTDGQEPTLPSGWEPRLEQLGVGALVVRWDPIPNQDAISYRVWVDDQTPVRQDAAHFVGEGAGQVAVMLLDGEPLAPGTDYWAAVEPYDPDGPAPAVETPEPVQVRQADQDLISAAYIYGGKISASQIESGQLNAAVALLGSISTAASGRNITMSSADGLKGADSMGNVVFHFPTDTTQGATLQAALTASSIDAIGKVSLRSNANEVKAGAKVILQKGTTPPVAAPTVVQEWTTLSSGNHFATTASGMDSGTYDPGQNLIYQGYAVGGSTGVHIYNADTGAYVTGFGSGLTGVACSVTIIGSVIYMLVENFSPSRTSTLRAFHKDTWQFLWEAPQATYGTANVVTTDGTDLFILHAPSVGQAQEGQLILEARNKNDGGGMSYWGPGVNTMNLAGQFPGVAYGGRAIGAVHMSFADVGVKSIWVTSRSQPGQVFSFRFSDGARQGGYEFPTAYSEDVAALFWDGNDGVFKSNSRNSGRLFQYDGIRWDTGTANETWEASYTWYDGDTVNGTHETTQSPVASYTQAKRAHTVVTAPPIPDNGGVDDPDRVRIYLGYHDGARTSQWLQTTTAPGVRTAKFSTVTFSGTNPPAASNFPDGTPGKIESSDGVMFLSGDGKFAGEFISRNYTGFLGNSTYGPGFNNTIASWNPIVAPAGARFVRIVCGTAGRAAGNAAGYWLLSILRGGTFESLWDYRFHNHVDQYVNFNPTLSAYAPLNGVGQIGVYLNLRVDAAGSAVTTYSAGCMVEWYR